MSRGAQSSRIKRGGSPRKTVKKSNSRALRKRSLIDRAMDHLPVSVATLRRIATGAIVGTVAIGGVAVASAFGVPQAAGVGVAEAIGRAGFEVERVEVTGIDRMERLTVYAIALDQHSMAMPLVDLDKVRDRLLDYGWIADARVSRRLPDTLLVDIVERTPSAVWQNNQTLWLVDAEGVVLEQIALDEMPDLPLVIGPDANRQIAGLNELMKAAPALDPMLAGATWVGNRRWDLRFQSGEVLALPQGEKEAAAALVRFARMDGMDRLLGRGFVRFDMRDPAKFVVRVPRGMGRKPAANGEGADAPTAAERAEG
ncbi:cell division protein FtsQ/DivIB [Sphingomonas gilva]|nr:cell division protein FtsQ/DivIB [Sphingomonas gilva]